ncbi:hypothetical protein CRG98_013447, partial [Punica granatum]
HCGDYVEEPLLSRCFGPSLSSSGLLKTESPHHTVPQLLLDLTSGILGQPVSALVGTILEASWSFRCKPGRGTVLDL